MREVVDEGEEWERHWLRGEGRGYPVVLLKFKQCRIVFHDHHESL